MEGKERDIAIIRLPCLTVAVLVLLLFSIRSYAQNSPELPVRIDPSSVAVNVSNEELVDLILKVVNKSATPLQGIIDVAIPAEMNLISKNNVPVSINPGDSLFVPVKVFVTRRTPSGREHLLRFSLKESTGTQLASSQTRVIVSEKRNVTMFALVNNILLDPSSDSIKVPVRITNQGNTAQTITVINRYPTVLQENAFHATVQLTLAPSADTLITFSKPVVRKMLTSEGFDVTFSGMYANGDVFGMAYVRVQSARNDRVFRDVNLSDTYNLNTLTLSSQSMFSANQSYLLTGRGTLELPKGMLGYNVDLTTWRNSYSPAMARNTFITYDSPNFGIVAGNINRNMDINLSGRGGSVSLKDTAGGNIYEVGFIDGNSNLFGNGFNSFFPTGQAGWGSFTHGGEKWELTSSAVYEVNPLLNSKSGILGNTFTLVGTEGLRIQGSLSGGHYTQYDNTANSRFSGAAGLAINGTFDKWLINSTNYVSTGYYPGLRRGALSFNERITWLRNRSNIWAGVDFNHYSPKTLSSFQSFDPVFSTLRAEIGMSGSVFGNLMLSAAPIYIRETNNSYRFPGIVEGMHSMQAWNMNNSLNYPISNNQYLSINTETGFYNSSFDPQTRFHFRSNVNYRRGGFNLSSIVQFGTFFISEAANNYVRGIDSQRLINIIPTYQKAFFRNKLRAEAGLAFINSSFFGNSMYLTGRAEYDVLSKTSFYTAVNHNRYGDYNLSLLEMGITQKLTLPKVAAKTGNIEVFVYRDANQNNVFDEGDVRADGHLLYINDAAFITNGSGMVDYRQLPVGMYRVSLTNTKGWYAPDRTIDLNEKRERIEVALKRTGTIRGSVDFVFSEFSYELTRSLQGITIIATDANNVTHVTKTNSEGQFVLYLPVGTYTLGTDVASLPAEVEQEKLIGPIILDPDTPQDVTVRLIVKNRKIETKKFTSPNTPRQP